MSARDYVFQIGCLGNTYLAKKIKSHQRISNDRRLVEVSEILGLFEHYVRKRCAELDNDTFVINDGEKDIIEVKLLDY